MEKLRLSNSKVGTFLHCRRAYYWSYVEGLTSKAKAIPLQVGDIVHQLLHKEFEGSLRMEDFQNLDFLVKDLYPGNDPNINLNVALQAATLVKGYLEKYTLDNIKIISSETHLQWEGPDYFIYGKIDGLCRTQDERLWRLERKTAGKMDTAYLNGLRTGRQAGIYHFLLDQLLEEKIYGTIYDILVKTKVPQYARVPTLTPKKLIERCLETLEGVYKDIKAGNFYPSNDCYTYSRECDYLSLCNHDSPEVRETFYDKKLKVLKEP